MSTLQAIPTQHGMELLNSDLKNTVTQYRLIGALTHDAPSESLYSFYENTIETSYYDDNGVLTFILNLPIEQHLDEYLHQIHVIDSGNQSVIECSTPKVALPKGIGGMVTLKAAISGEAGDVIFKHSEFVTETELVELHLTKYTLKDMAQFLPYDPERIYSVGEICYTKDQATGELSYWQWYSNVESLAGKSPLDTLNRQSDWTDDTKPFYWSPYKKARTGTPLFPWMSMTFPEGTLNVLGNSVPVAVFWRLAAALPEFVNAGTGMIDFPETGGEFFRVLDQGRSIDPNRSFASWQKGSAVIVNDRYEGHLMSIEANNIHDNVGIRHSAGLDNGLYSDYSNIRGLFIPGATPQNNFMHASGWGGGVSRPRNLAFPILVEV